MSTSDALSHLLGAASSAVPLALRSQVEGDWPLLRELFVARRWHTLGAAPGLTDEQRLALLHAQAQLQQLHYQRHYPTAQFLIIEHAGQGIGRLCVLLGAQQLRVVDIALLPAWQGRGLGSQLLAAVLALADVHGTPCCLSVEPLSPALRLYTRLGFQVTEDQGADLQMRRPASPPQTATARHGAHP